MKLFIVSYVALYPDGRTESYLGTVAAMNRNEAARIIEAEGLEMFKSVNHTYNVAAEVLNMQHVLDHLLSTAKPQAANYFYKELKRNKR